jgi:hypothetical protein
MNYLAADYRCELDKVARQTTMGNKETIIQDSNQNVWNG